MFRHLSERAGDDGFLCEPDFFFHRFRPYISTWTARFEGEYDDANNEAVATLRTQLDAIDALSSSGTGLPDLSAHRSHLLSRISALQRVKRLCGPSGAMSAILPLCDAFLGISMSSPELGAMLAVFEE